LPCLAELTAAQKSKTWGPWFVNGQTAGYWEQYDLYTYATVKGGGHEAPQYQPLSSYNMFERFMKTQSMDDPSGNVHRAALPRRNLNQGDMLRKAMEQLKK